MYNGLMRAQRGRDWLLATPVPGVLEAPYPGRPGRNISNKRRAPLGAATAVRSPPLRRLRSNFALLLRRALNTPHRSQRLLRRRQRPTVTLAVGRQRKRIEHHKG
jgi:hypothetical protein